MRSVLFVCTGNICRSPSAAAVFRHLLKEAGLDEAIRVDSAGTHDYHVGEPADRRASNCARQRGYELGGHRARSVCAADLEEFDLLVAMDRGHVRELERQAGARHKHKVRLFMAYAGIPGVEDVPDPYYGGADGFERVLDMIEQAGRGLLKEVTARD